MLLALLGSMTGCQDRLRDEFQDPEKNNPRPEDIIPGMLTQLQYTRFFLQDYGEWYWNFAYEAVLPAYAQVAVIPPIPGWEGDYGNWEKIDGSGYWRNSGNSAQTTFRFNQYYTDMKNWGLLRDEMATLSGKDLDDNEIFFLTATVLKDDVGMRTVDIFNRIPYKDGFGGTEGIFFPRYDDAKEIYTTILTELAGMTTRIPAAFAKMSDAAKQAFTKNDLAFKGDPEKWVQYCNALILRHAVRISGVDEAFAKPLIAEAVKNLPKVDFIWNNPKRNQNRYTGGGGEIYSRAFWEAAYSTYIPNNIMARMNFDTPLYVPGEDDPRLPVIANPTRYQLADVGEEMHYVGVSMDYATGYKYWPTAKLPTDPAPTPAGAWVDHGEGLTARIWNYYPQNIGAWLAQGYSSYNLGTFTHGNIPCYMTSLAEVDLLLAEVAAKGYASTPKSAAQHVRDAVIHSTTMWYDVNNGGGDNSLTGTNIFSAEGFPAQRDLLTKVLKPTRPESGVVSQFADKIAAQMTAAGSDVEAQMEVIMQQKYVHLNVLNIYELWAEVRRTHHPKLEALTPYGATEPLKVMVERAFYPTSELSTNAENYYTVQNEDNATSPIFWVPEKKKSETYFRNDYLPTLLQPLPDPNPNATDGTKYSWWPSII